MRRLKMIGALLLTAVLLLGALAGCGEKDSGLCGDNLNWMLDEEGTLTISGFGAMENYTAKHPAPWKASAVNRVEILPGVTTIGESAFANCNNLTSVSIPDSVLSIGVCAFLCCEDLVSVSVPASVEWIGNGAFNSCERLAKVELQEGLVTIGDYAFGDCIALSSVYIPKSLSFLGADAFGLSNVSVVYYAGDEARWSAVVDAAKQNALSNAQIYYEVSFVAILEQPESVSAHKGEAAATSVKASGDGLTYKWYSKDVGDTMFTLSSTFTGPAYSTQMNEERDGRQIYCVVTDKYGNSLETDRVTLSRDRNLYILEQPQSVTVPNGQKATVTVKASGEELSYRWYAKSLGETLFQPSDAFDGNTYSVTMDKTRAERQVYCVITDCNGNQEQTDTVILSMTGRVKITEVTKQTTAKSGERVKVQISATGDGLSYAWYYMDAGEGAYKLTESFTGNHYDTEMNAERDGRKVYCVVTDQYGNQEQTEIFTLFMTPTTAKILRQPESVVVASGRQVMVQLEAEGDGLIYRWYVKDVGETEFKVSTGFDGNTYAPIMKQEMDGRQVYCVITDAYDTRVVSETVTITLK